MAGLAVLVFAACVGTSDIIRDVAQLSADVSLLARSAEESCLHGKRLGKGSFGAVYEGEGSHEGDVAKKSNSKEIRDAEYIVGESVARILGSNAAGVMALPHGMCVFEDGEFGYYMERLVELPQDKFKHNVPLCYEMMHQLDAIYCKLLAATPPQMYFDLKPPNLMLTPNKKWVKLVDYGGFNQKSVEMSVAYAPPKVMQAAGSDVTTAQQSTPTFQKGDVMFLQPGKKRKGKKAPDANEMFFRREASFLVASTVISLLSGETPLAMWGIDKNDNQWRVMYKFMNFDEGLQKTMEDYTNNLATSLINKIEADADLPQATKDALEQLTNDFIAELQNRIDRKSVV